MYLANTTSGLRVFDVSNPAAPVFLSFFNTNGSAIGVYVDGDFAYVADGNGGLKIASGVC